MDTQENAGWLGSPLESQYNNPGHKFEVRSMLDVTRKLDWDSSVAYVARTQLAPSYTRVDTRLGWRLGERTDLSVVGQNLLAPRHAEYSDQETIGYTLVERSVSAKITWHF
jgi:iron complex outermembrane receptor protein